MSDGMLTTTLEHFRSHEVYFVRRTGPYPLSAPAAWTALWAWLQAEGLGAQVRRAIGFGRDDPRYTPADDIRYDACFEIADGPEVELDAGVGQQTVPGGPYVVHRLAAPYAYISATLPRLHQQVLDAGLEVDVIRPFQEIYVTGPDASPPVTDLCIPIKLPDDGAA